MGGMLSMIYKAGTKVKNWSYDYHFLDQVEVPCPVISVGNLSVGGTGKTPITHKLYEKFSRRFHRIAIVSRNYKAIMQQMARVDVSHPNGALFYGDEPAWLAARCVGSQVFIGPRKYETALYAYEQRKPDLIIVDDGFQHRALRRNLDLVLWDMTSLNENLIPSGRLREDFSSLDRSDYVLLTKVNWAEPLQVERWRMRLKGRPTVDVHFELDLNLDWVARTKDVAVAGFAGIANPNSFRNQLQLALHKDLDGFWSFPDHYDYPRAGLDVLETWLRQNPDGYLFTTEKDTIKLRPWVQQMARVIAVPLRLEWGQGSNEFFEFLDHVGR